MTATHHDARAVALKTLEAYRRKEIWPDIFLSSYKENNEITNNDFALTWHIVYGVIQNKILLDYYISKYSSIPIGKLHPTVLDILRLSMYQIIFLSKIPHSAVVNEGVNLTRKNVNIQASRFTNAILRKFSVDADDKKLPDIKASSESENLSIKYSHPEWLVNKFISLLGLKDAEILLQKNNMTDTVLHARVNTLKASTDEVLTLFQNDNINAVKSRFFDDYIELCGVGNVSKLDSFQEGKFYIQDPASWLSVFASGLKSGDTVIDGCSAPGGKAFAAAILMKNTGNIVAYDINQNKIQEIDYGAKRLGIEIIKALILDSTQYNNELTNTADVVLADVPCSGFGVIRKKPEIRYKSIESIADLPDIQGKILSNLSLYVKPGGVLLYSTCTILKSENEDVIKNFLKNNPGFRVESFTLPYFGEVQTGMITLWPHIHQTDGFFICKLRKV